MLFVLAGHSLLFAIQIPRAYIGLNYGNSAIELHWPMLGRIAWQSVVEALITPLILLAGYHIRLHRKRIFRNLSLHLFLACVAGVIFHFVFYGGLVLGYYIGTVEFTPERFNIFYANTLRWQFFVLDLPPKIVNYAVIIAIQHAYLYFKEFQEQALLLKESELQMLEMQLHPHFFFNTLNAIAALTHRAPEEATRLIARLGEMLRMSLQKDKPQEVPLKEELEFLKAFLHIHKTLMGRRLQVEWEIDRDALDALVPNMLLQPLVENAIQHGLAPLATGGTLSISARRENAELILEVRDNGKGLASPDSTSGGIGLANTRARLAKLYDGSHEISLTGKPGGGATTRIRLPFRELGQETANED